MRGAAKLNLRALDLQPAVGSPGAGLLPAGIGAASAEGRGLGKHRFQRPRPAMCGAAFGSIRSGDLWFSRYQQAVCVRSLALPRMQGKIPRRLSADRGVESPA